VSARSDNSSQILFPGIVWTGVVPTDCRDIPHMTGKVVSRVYTLALTNQSGICNLSRLIKL
jgi:hypothetical protein